MAGLPSQKPGKCTKSFLIFSDVTIKEEKPTLASVLATKDNSESASHSDDEEEDQTDEDQNSENDFQNSKDPQLISSCSSKMVLPKLFFVCLPSLLIMLFGSPFSAKSSETTAESTAQTTAAAALKKNFNFGLLFIQDMGKQQKNRKLF